ncbi:polysaccharide deacetylase family protein [Peribacillus muralis]|uniref:polysaccharide deacetylase family protein n=1 Tax=Peribacillus muralis TaxID=264697 RepID=UPI001F4E92E5|nr:polysaccharide deacetylase family protein [Peribacillus muralis]MCK1992636.1 polysaccharide deacetylase family protein [Peribacillus muralis]MCK2013192.1 polysaccharide deacetylase family protein [Peribacillus muralis]
MINKVMVLFTSVALLLIGCTGQDSDHAKEKHQSVETAASAQDEGQREKEEQEEAPKAENTEEKVKPEYRVNKDTWSFEPIGDADPKVVLLTFDDAPDKYSLEIAKTLHRLKVPAIFFVNGHFLENDANKAMLKEIHELGFPIGNHTYSHVNLTELTEKEQEREIVKLNNLVEGIIGERPKYFRAPFGSNTNHSKEVAKKEKMLVMNWTYGYDWEKEYQDKNTLTEIMLNSPYLGNGANLLMHDRKWTSEAIEDIVKGFQKKGYEILDPNLIETPA